MGTVCVLVSFPFLWLPAIGLNVEENCTNNGTTPTPNPTAFASTSGTSMVFAASESGEECEGVGEMAVTAYYSAFVVLFQFGWATVQISHLSMIPDITACEKSRMSLTSIRYAATVMSSILVYCVTWLLLETSKHILDFRNDNLEIFD